jgi:Golgi phosphoprotein 3 (GPP34)
MRLTLADELLLLARRDEEGRMWIGSTELNCGMAGALLAELALAEQVRLVDGRITAVDSSPLGDPDLDAMLQQILADGKPRPAERWIKRFRQGGLRNRRLARLADLGVLETREHKILGFIRHTSYPERDPAARNEVHARLRALVEGGPADDRSSALLAIVHACKLDRKVFPDVDRGSMRRRVKEITEQEWAGRAVAKVIASIHAGVSAAVAGAVIAGSAGSAPGN